MEPSWTKYIPDDLQVVREDYDIALSDETFLKIALNPSHAKHMDVEDCHGMPDSNNQRDSTVWMREIFTDVAIGAESTVELMFLPLIQNTPFEDASTGAVDTTCTLGLANIRTIPTEPQVGQYMNQWASLLSGDYLKLGRYNTTAALPNTVNARYHRLIGYSATIYNEARAADQSGAFECWREGLVLPVHYDMGTVVSGEPSYGANATFVTGAPFITTDNLEHLKRTSVIPGGEGCYMVAEMLPELNTWERCNLPTIIRPDVSTAISTSNQQAIITDVAGASLSQNVGTQPNYNMTAAPFGFKPMGVTYTNYAQPGTGDVSTINLRIKIVAIVESLNILGSELTDAIEWGDPTPPRNDYVLRVLNIAYRNMLAGYPASYNDGSKLWKLLKERFRTYGKYAAKEGARALLDVGFGAAPSSFGFLREPIEKVLNL